MNRNEEKDAVAKDKFIGWDMCNQGLLLRLFTMSVCGGNQKQYDLKGKLIWKKTIVIYYSF